MKKQMNTFEEVPVNERSISKRKFISSCRTREGKVKQLGYYKTPEEAHMAWREYMKKIDYIILEEQDNPEIKEAFIKYVDEL